MILEAFDVETSGVDRAYALQPFRATLAQWLRHGEKQAWLTSFATAWREAGEIETTGELCPGRARLKILLDRYAATGVYVVGWNTPFDVAWLIALGLREEVFKIKWLDAMLLYKHVTSSPRYLPAEDTCAPKNYGLKQAVKDFFPGEAGYEEGVEFALDDDDHVGFENLLDYNKLDSSHTLRLAEKFLRELTPDQLRAALIEAECIPLIADSMVTGIRTDVEAATKLSQKLLEDAQLAFVTLCLQTNQPITEKLLASPTQLRQLLYKDWMLPVTKWTDHETNPQPSTDKEALLDLADIDPRAKLIKDYREAHNNRTKFAEGAIVSTAYNGDGCTRPTPRIFGTYTGRLTYSSKQGRGKTEKPVGVALHQWKRGAEFRDLLVAPEGFTLLEHDFAGQEFKWMAVESGDPTMLQLCQPGEDPHAYMAGRIARIEYRLIQKGASVDILLKKTRQLGKVANLSLQYRTGWQRLMIVAKTQYDVIITEAEARAIHATYRTTYLDVPRYWRRQIYDAKRLGYAETLAGRRVQLGFGNEWAEDSKWSYESTAINFPIQGVGADQKYLGLKMLRNYLPSVDGRFYYELHDGLFTITPDRYAEKAAVEIKHILSNLPYKEAWGKVFPIQFPVDAKLGKSWGSLKEIHA